MKMRTVVQNPWAAAKGYSKRKVQNKTTQPQEKSQMNNLTSHLKELEKEPQKAQNQQTEIKIRAEMNETKEVNETRSQFSRKNKIDKPLARLIRREGTKSEMKEIPPQKYKGL